MLLANTVGYLNIQLQRINTIIHWVMFVSIQYSLSFSSVFGLYQLLREGAFPLALVANFVCLQIVYSVCFCWVFFFLLLKTAACCVWKKERWDWTETVKMLGRKTKQWLKSVSKALWSWRELQSRVKKGYSFNRFFTTRDTFHKQLIIWYIVDTKVLIIAALITVLINTNF